MPVCPQCDNRVFTNKEALLQHMKSSSAWHPFCSICDRRFVSQTAYDAHMAAKHPPTYDCLTCSKSFHAPFALEDHYRGSQNHPNCVRCGRGFFDEGAREEHLLTAHPKFPCGPCGGILVYEDALEQHYSDSPHHPSCMQCGKGFKDDSAYAEHIAEIHADLHCKSCKTSFDHAEATQAHFWSSSSHPKCDQCSLGFEDNEARESHIEMVHAPTPTATATAVASTEPASPVPNIFPPAEMHLPAPEGLSKRDMTPLYSTGFTPLSPKNHAQRLIIGERRIDTPDLQLHMNYASPLTDVKPLFSPTSLPRPGGIIEELWSSRENVEVPTTSKTLPQRPPPERQSGHGSPIASNQSASPRTPLWTSPNQPHTPPRINTLTGSRSPPRASSSRSSFFSDPTAPPLSGPYQSVSSPRNSHYEPPSRPHHTTAYSSPSSFGSATSSTFDTSRFTTRRENRHISPPTVSPSRADFQSRLYPGSVRHAARAASFTRPSPPSETALGTRGTSGTNYPFGGGEYGIPLTQPRHAFMFGASNPGGGSSFGRVRGAASLTSASTTSEQVSWRELIGSRTPETRSEYGAGSTGNIAGSRFFDVEDGPGIPTPRAEAPQSLSASSSGGLIPLESTPPTISQTHQLPSSPSLATVSSPSSSALGRSPGSLHEPDTRPTTASSNWAPSVHEMKYTISVTSDFSTHSPDTSSPIGLGMLPTVSPLISTPLDVSSLELIPEAQKPLPASPPPEPPSPVTVVLELLEDTREPSPQPQLCGSETDVELELEPPPKSVSPVSASGSSSQSYITSPQEPFDEHEDTTNTAVSVPSPAALPSKVIQVGGVASPLLTPTGTPPVVAATMPSNPLHCRVCLADTCDDITASMCGHIFCNRCITDAVIKTNRCPVCMTPTLLYCLFRLDLAA
ncbi:hypothetical protein CPB83DRAFT_196651 [Crepidotus variabilis]|uniref:RING-type E3 ubiquitin transferase n=1 Tax=Crepidotus variabilis TaxID=179855 RepID=A0A9P6JQT2_9AGAR|nr:hypothetical protein CPB83DRAFT_196651 [Crepidotus variabilis]